MASDESSESQSVEVPTVPRQQRQAPCPPGPGPFRAGAGWDPVLRISVLCLCQAGEIGGVDFCFAVPLKKSLVKV